MSNLLLKYNYPQVVFGKQIANYLLKTGKSFNTIVDCPCGNGETSWYIAKITHSKIIAADISSEAIARAQLNFAGVGIRYQTKDIRSVLASEKEFDAFCIINSLFLLGDYDNILRSLKESVAANDAQLLVIIPNTVGKNFRWFQTQNKTDNKLIIEEREIKWFFEKYGFKTNFIKPICYTHHYNRTDVKLFSVFWSVYLNILNIIQTTFKIGKPNYFLIALNSK
jgi:2-polyprenyl-3-methyl-5-hydroxy-6-metoxy-1,4-benzoquinol methylase